MKKPFLQFAVNDHLNDLNLRACHPAARGIWMDMQCLMAQGQPYGHLKLEPPKMGSKERQQAESPPPDRPPAQAPARPGGTPHAPPHAPPRAGALATPGGLAQTAYNLVANGNLEPMLDRLLGEPPEMTRWAIAHLEAHGVFSRTAEGIIYSRRMVRDHERHENRVKRALHAYQRRAADRHKSRKTPPPGPPPGGPNGTPDAPPLAPPPGGPSARADARAGGVPGGPSYNQNQILKEHPPVVPPHGGTPRPAAGAQPKTTRHAALVDQVRQRLSRGGKPT